MKSYAAFATQLMKANSSCTRAMASQWNDAILGRSGPSATLIGGLPAQLRHSSRNSKCPLDIDSRRSIVSDECLIRVETGPSRLNFDPVQRLAPSRPGDGASGRGHLSAVLLRNPDIFFSAAESRAIYWWSPDRTARGCAPRGLKRREGLALGTCGIEPETGKRIFYLNRV